MPGKQHRIVGHLRQALREAVIHLARVTARQVGAAASVEEERVAGNEAVVDEETLAARRVARRVDQLDFNRPDGDDVAASCSAR